ncbi:MAG TPA: PAS-domain containing protein [Caulobacteraceae bacterium]|nr:PAS-domain containing protein [Caulobacteraceae bacterium]
MARPAPRRKAANGPASGAGAPPADRVLLRASAEAFERALIVLDGERTALAAGETALEACARALGVPGCDAPTVIEALARLDPAAGVAVRALGEAGTPCDLAAAGLAGTVRASGRTVGALALLSLWVEPAPAARAGEGGGRLADFIEAHPYPAYVAAADGAPRLVNHAWLEAAGAASLEDALARGLAFDRGANDLIQEALAAGAPRERVRWLGPSTARRALRLRAAPLADGEAAVLSWDVTAAEGAAEALGRQVAAQDAILAETADAVAIFDADQRLAWHNPAFARLWDLEPAWLAEQPSHGALLDRLRQGRRLAEAPDWARFKAEELARHGRLQAAPEAIWRVGGERILRVLSLPHPAGGLIMLFSDITPEVRLKSQFNHLIQVQQATLDKLTDAVAVFGADGRLKLHNEAFQSLWAIPPEALAGGPGFDEVVERCVALLHDMHFWGGLKGRITDPDPGVRAPARGETRIADGRRLAWQSRPLPDGATLVSFIDITDAKALEGALRDREAALADAEKLKRDFVSSVSHELRTPLTTILGYAELLEIGGEALSGRARRWVAAVRAAGTDLARSVEDILAFSEIDAGEMTLDLAETDVAQLLGQACGRWGERAREGGVALELAIAEAPGTMRADAAGLGRVLDHLIDHALRQTAPGGRVTLSARRAPGEVCLEVADTGRGIPFHVQAHIFDRFTGEEGAAAGLGLALVKALVELHGGWVALESEPGAGSAFACHLPVAGQVPDPARLLI